MATTKILGQLPIFWKHFQRRKKNGSYRFDPPKKFTVLWSRNLEPGPVGRLRTTTYYVSTINLTGVDPFGGASLPLECRRLT